MTGITRLFRRLGPPAQGHNGLVADAPPVPVRSIFTRFWPYTRRHRWWVALSLLLIVIIPVIQAVEIWLFKIVVDDVLVPRDLGPFAWIAAAYVALNLLSGVVGYWEEYLATWVGERFLLALRSDLFRHLLRLAPDWLEKKRLGDILTRLTGDVSAVEQLVLTGVQDLVSSGARLIFFAGALFYLDWLLALAALVVAPLFWVTARRLASLIRQAARVKRRRSGSLASVAEESLSNLWLAQAYNQQRKESNRFVAENEGIVDAELASTRLRATLSPLVDLIELAGGILVIAIGTWSLANDRLSLGGLLVFLTYLTQLYGPVRDLSHLGGTVFAASASAERIIELLDQPALVQERRGAVSLVGQSASLEFDNVTFTYPDKTTPALERISFLIEPGEFVAVVGPSGAGKSTVLKLLLRFYDPAQGRILIGNQDIRGVTVSSVRNQVAVLFQEPFLLNGTIRDNIAYARPDASAKEIDAAARAADLHDFIVSLPHGYDTRVGQKGRALSGGQRQRVALARALLTDSPILVIDELATGLDAQMNSRILDSLMSNGGGRTTILITHDLDTARRADRILVMDAGRIVEEGSHRELLTRTGPYARLWTTADVESAPRSTSVAMAP
jgi:ATP-binding cassette, subfamily B, bacterial